jgi:triosephosphate isomerase
MRRLLVAGNWKMHGSVEMTAELISGVARRVLEMATISEQRALPYDILVCPPAPYLAQAVVLSDSQPIAVGAQNVNAYEDGAFTGEVSLPMLAEIGCEYVLLGHSERRELFAETDQIVAEKFAACVDSSSNIVPVLCLGETLDDRQAGQTQAVVARQLDAVLEKSGVAGFANAVVAYEPVWAIGTGETASPAQAQEVHAFIRAKLAELDANIAANLQILYGGSVKPTNAEELFGQADIDGGLIGGASLKIESFAGICEAAEKLSK